jgi:hypothetical protein
MAQLLWAFNGLAAFMQVSNQVLTGASVARMKPVPAT